MNQRSLRRIANIRKILAALAHGSIGPAATADLLGVSPSAARNYLDALVQDGVALPDRGRKTNVVLHPDQATVRRFLENQEVRGGERRITLRRSLSRHCVNPGASFVHVLADDVRFPLTLGCQPATRDPLVAALFGASGCPSVR
jgi:predicted transcriptional regulator